MMTDLKSTVDLVIGLIKQAGIGEYEAQIGAASGISTAVRLQQVESLQKHLSQSFVISVYNGGKKGSASSVDLSKQGLAQAIEAAKTIAKYTSDDPFIGLADADKMAWQLPDLDLYYPWQLDAKHSIEMAKCCESAALDEQDIDNSEGAQLSSVEHQSYYLNATGLVAYAQHSSHTLSCSVIAQGKDEMQTAYDYDSVLDKNDLVQPQTIGSQAAIRARAKLAAGKLNSQKCAVVFSAELSASLLSTFFAAISGRRQYTKNTFLLNQQGKQVFPQWLDIEEIPHAKKTIGASAYDSDGVATQRKFIIKNGCLETYLLGQYAANQLGLETTANADGVHNCVISHNAKDQQALLRQMDKGVLVTELMGQGVNLTTGNYSRGAAGFWVEGGRIQHPLSGFTIAGILPEMFQRIVAVGADIDRRKTIKCGALLIDQMTIAGNH